VGRRQEPGHLRRRLPGARHRRRIRLPCRVPGADLILLCVKPNDAPVVLATLRNAGLRRETLLISILAGVGTDRLESLLGTENPSSAPCPIRPPWSARHDRDLPPGVTPPRPTCSARSRSSRRWAVACPSTRFTSTPSLRSAAAARATTSSSWKPWPMPACAWGCRDSLPSRWWRRQRSAPRAWCSPPAVIRPPCATTSPRRPAAPSAACSCWKTGASARCWRGPWKRPPGSPRISASAPPRFPKAAAAALRRLRDAPCLKSNPLGSPRISSGLRTVGVRTTIARSTWSWSAPRVSGCTPSTGAAISIA